MNFDVAYNQCVATGRCEDLAGADDGSTGTGDGGVADSDAGSDPSDAGPDDADGGPGDGGGLGPDGGDAGCTPGPIPTTCAMSWCEVYQSPSQQPITAVYGFSPTDVWVAGGAGLTAHWDGCRWTEHFLTDLPAISSIWGASPSAVWFVGSKTGTTAIRRYNANGFFSTHDTGAVGSLNAVSGSSPNDVWMVGSREGTAVVNTVVLHWNGASFKQFSAAELPNGTTYLVDVWSTGPGEAWMVGSGSNIWKRSNGTWETSTPPGTHFGVWAASPDEVWVTGASGRILRGDGGTGWTEVSSGTSSGLYEIHGHHPTRAWAVGTGDVVRYDGISWRTETVRPGSIFRDVWAGSDTEVWIVTNEGAVLHNRR